MFRDDGTNDQPEGVTGRRALIKSRPANAVFVLQGVLSPAAINELKVGYNSAPTEVSGLAPTVNGIDLQTVTLNITGSVANTGIAGQAASTGVAIPGGLLRQNSATNGRGAPYDPYSISLIDNVSWNVGRHALKFGGEFRAIRMETDRLGGTTYTWSNLNDFLANRLQQVQYLSDLSEPSPFNNGATGPRHTKQQVLHRLRPGRMEGDQQLHRQLRPPLRLLHAAARARRPAGALRHRERSHPAGDERPVQDLEDQLPAACLGDLGARRVAQDRRARRIRACRRTGADGGSDPAHRERSDLEHALRRGVPDRPEPAPRQLPEQPAEPRLSAARVSARIQGARARLAVHRLGAARAEGRVPGHRRVCRQPGPEPVPSEYHQPDCRGPDQPDADVERDRHPPVRHRERRRIESRVRSRKSTSRRAAATTATTRCSSRWRAGSTPASR